MTGMVDDDSGTGVSSTGGRRVVAGQISESVRANIRRFIDDTTHNILGIACVCVFRHQGGACRREGSVSVLAPFTRQTPGCI